MVEITNLTKRYGSITALDHVSFNVKKGEILGFLGPNGAGKSTTMNILTGYISSTAGSVKVDGFDILDEPAKVKRKIGYLPENPPLYTEMTVLEYLNFIAQLKSVKKADRKEHIQEIMKLVKIDDHQKRVLKNLSKGYKQRAGLAQALIGNPEVLVLDEPTVGLDPKQIIEIRNLIKKLGKNHTIILSSHILPEVSAVCDRVVIINKGAIVVTDTPANLSSGLSERSNLVIRVSGPKNPVSKALGGVTGLKKVTILAKVEEDVYDYELEAQRGIDIRKAVFFQLAKAGFPILETRTTDLSLEDVFIKLINNTEQKEIDGDKQEKEEEEKNDSDI